MTDPGKSDDSRAGERRRPHRCQLGAEDREAGLAQPIGRGAVADQHDRVGAGEARRDRFAQRPGRDHPAVAEAVFGIDDDQRQILLDPGF